MKDKPPKRYPQAPERERAWYLARLVVAPQPSAGASSALAITPGCLLVRQVNVAMSVSAARCSDRRPCWIGSNASNQVRLKRLSSFMMVNSQ